MPARARRFAERRRGAHRGSQARSREAWRASRRCRHYSAGRRSVVPTERQPIPVECSRSAQRPVVRNIPSFPSVEFCDLCLVCKQRRDYLVASEWLQLRLIEPDPCDSLDCNYSAVGRATEGLVWRGHTCWHTSQWCETSVGCTQETVLMAIPWCVLTGGTGASVEKVSSPVCTGEVDEIFPSKRQSSALHCDDVRRLRRSAAETTWSRRSGQGIEKGASRVRTGQKDGQGRAAYARAHAQTRHSSHWRCLSRHQGEEE